VSRHPQPARNRWCIPLEGLDLPATIDRLEGGFLRAAFLRAGGRRAPAAALLGLTFGQYVYRQRRLKKRAARRVAQNPTS